MKDTISKLIFRCLNVLFLYNVLGTSYGCLAGILLKSLQPVIAIYIPSFGLIKWYGFIAFGILLFNFKPIVQKEYMHPKIEIELKYIRDMLKESNLSASEKRLIWRETITKVSNELLSNMEDSDGHREYDPNVPG